MKDMIRRKLVAAMLADRCKSQTGILFDEALCSQERVIRFATPQLREIFPRAAAPAGKWKSRDLALYEFHNGADAFFVTVSVSPTGLTAAQQMDRAALFAAADGDEDSGLLRRWDYPQAAGDPGAIMEAVSDFFEAELPFFQRELAAWQGDHSRRLARFPDLGVEEVPRDELPETVLLEGGERDGITNRFERSLAARRRCVAAWGTACRICGFDFGTVYGPDLAGKIEVHHIVPISEIGESYVIDPVRDLIPVCPNCHTTLHGKPGGVYTPEELRRMIQENTKREEEAR